MKILHTIVLAFLVYYAASQVIGIDLGTQFWKASLISPGKNLIIVENSRSSRKSHNGIAFLEGVRHFQYDAFSKRQKKPKSTYFYLNRLVESLDQPQPLDGYRFENGTYYFTEGEDTLSLEQLVGMIMKNIKKYASAQAGSDIKDAVLTVPAHWGFKARMSLVNAAILADLNTLGLINQNSAAAIHFAITRNDTDPINIGFFNMGSHNLQISIVQFFGTLDEVKSKNIESLRVLSHVSVPNVGGLQVDKELADFIADQFMKKNKLDVRKNQKSYVKLLHKCADLKQTLSANKQAHIYIEALIEGIDLNMVVKREQLEKSSIFQIAKQQLDVVIEKAGITKDQLTAVEIIGGGSRIPLIGKIIKEYFDPVEVGSHINGDESMAFGSALRAANLSITFRVKQLHFYDGYPETVRAVVSTIEDGVIAESSIFDKDSEHGLKKELVVDESEEDLKVTIFYGQQIIHEYIVANLSNWKQKYNQTTFNITQKPKTVLIFISNTISIADLKEAYVNITLNTSTTKQVYEVVVQNVTIEQQTTQSQNKQTEQTKQENKNKQESTDEAKKDETEGQKAEQSNGESKEETTAESETNSTKSKKRRERERSKTVKKIVDDFKIENKKLHIKPENQFTKYKKYTKDEADLLKEVIHKYEKHQNQLKDKAKIRNDFESTLYRLKDDFDSVGLKTFSTESQLEKLKESVAQQLIWLEDNAWTAQKVDFEKHFRSIQRVYNPIVNRSNEYSDRESTYNKTIQVLSLVYQKTAQLNQSQPWVSEKALEHMKKVNETVEWIHAQLKKQMERKYNEDAIFYNHEMINKAEDLRDQYYLIKMIPRPKVVKKVQPQETEIPKPKSEEEVDLDAEQTNKEENKDSEDNKNSENQQNKPQTESNNEENASIKDQEAKEDL